MAALILSGCSGGVGALELDQPRLDTPAPRIEGEEAVAQTFVAPDDGLAAIELLLAVYPDTPPSGVLTLRLRDEVNAEVGSLAVPLSSLRHNEPLRFEFQPQRDSAGRTYRLTFSGPPKNPATFWSSRADVYADGELWSGGQRQAGDLQFKLFSRLGYLDLLALGVRNTGQHWWLGVVLVAVFYVPGRAALALFRPRWRAVAGEYRLLLDPAGRFAASVGLSLAFWPLLFLALSLTPIRLGPLGAWVIAGGLGVVVAVDVWRRRWQREPMELDERLGLAAFAALVVVTGAVRAVHARGLVVPPWVDSIQHAVAVELFVTGGRLPVTWGPEVLDSPFFYHFGFHAVTATLVWFSGLGVPGGMLVAGQVLNVLVGVGTYLLTARLTGRRDAALVALAIVGTVTLMPAYYLTWGRYTQLTGLALLPAATVFTFDAISGRPQVRVRIGLAAMAAAALLVTHYRVLLMYGMLVVAFLVTETALATWRRRWFAPLWGRAALVALAAGVLALPWLVRLGLVLVPGGRLGAWFDAPASFNTPHWGLLALRYQRELMLLSALGAALAFWWRPTLVAVVALASGLTVLVTNPTLLGLRNSWVFSNDSLIITAFLPLAVLAGYALTAAGGWAARRLDEQRRRVAKVAATVALVVGAVYAADGMLSVVNPITVLATRDDAQAAAWIKANTPASAVFLVNARAWQEGAFAASDGGGWLPILADRRVTLPPVSYAYTPSVEALQRVAEVARASAEATGADAVRPMIEREGVTHVYIGAKGGALRPEMFQGRPDFKLVYTNGAAWVFEVVRTGAARP